MSARQPSAVGTDMTGARKGLWVGLLAFRWISYAWVVALAATTPHFRPAWAAWMLIAVVGAWTLWLTATHPWSSDAAMWLDLALAFLLLVGMATLIPEREVIGAHPFVAGSYPVSAAMFFGASKGWRWGLFAGFLLSLGVVATRPVNGISLASMGLAQIQQLGNGSVLIMAAGGTVGLISQVLTRSAQEIAAANRATVRERERVARLEGRERLGRQIHDSVLQSLALINKRGKELAERAAVPGEEVAELAALAAAEERELRALIVREDDILPGSERVSLRDTLEASGVAIEGVSVEVGCTGPILLPTRTVSEVRAAVDQALDNVVLHASATRVTVFADEVDGTLTVSVRDDGIGFDYDEAALATAGKLGILGSMKGRIEDLGGSMHIDSEPGSGTEVEFRLPVGQDDGR